jgi:tRNA(fMet)-specific endonuclease VapC
MTKRYMLDTNIVSQLLREHPQVLGQVLATPMESLCISSITEGELLFGLANNPANLKLKQAVQELLRRVDSIAWDSAVARKYGEVRAQMQKQGKGIGNLDLLIASHAIAIDAILVTNDQAMFLVPHVNTEDWTIKPVELPHS